MNMDRNAGAKNIALSGLLAAFAVLILFLESIAPTNKLSLYVLSSFLVAVVIIEIGIRAGWIFYITTSLLAFIVVPDKIAIIPYIIFFGIYGIIKCYIERLRNLPVEWVVKLLFFNAFIMAAVLFIKEYFLKLFGFNIQWWLLLVLFEVIFVVFDYVFTLFIQYYNAKLRSMLKLK